MGREQIIDTIKNLAKSQGFYSRLLNCINNARDEEREAFLSELEEQKFKDTVDLVIYLEA